MAVPGYRKLSTWVPQVARISRIDVAGDGVLPVDEQARAVGILVGQPLGLAGQTGRLGVGGEVQPAGPNALRDHPPVFSPPSLNVGSLGPVTRLPQTKGNSVAWAAAMRSSRSIGVAKSKRYR